MPTLSLDIPPAAVTRLNAMLDRRGFEGTPQERLGEIKRMCRDYLHNEVRQSESDAALEAVAESDLGIT